MIYQSVACTYVCRIYLHNLEYAKSHMYCACTSNAQKMRELSVQYNACNSEKLTVRIAEVPPAQAQDIQLGLWVTIVQQASLRHNAEQIQKHCAPEASLQCLRSEVDSTYSTTDVAEVALRYQGLVAALISPALAFSYAVRHVQTGQGG